MRRKLLITFFVLVSCFACAFGLAACEKNYVEKQLGDFNYVETGNGYEVTGVKNSHITEAVITEGVTSIARDAFRGCSELKSITIPDSVTYIGYEAFVGCDNIENAIIPALAISSIPRKNLETVVITSGDTIGENAFWGCTKLKTVTIPESVISIEQCAFAYSSLSEVNYAGDIANWCGISGLGNIIISENIKLYIKGKELNDELVIPDGVTSIGAYAFMSCSELTSVIIPVSVTSIGRGSFGYSEYRSLLEIKYLGDIASWCGINGLSNIMVLNKTLYIDGTELKGELIIPDSVTSIAACAFYGCGGLTGINIPDSVDLIGEAAFSNCNNVENAKIPATAISSIPKINLKTVEITSGTVIENFAFAECDSLQSISIPDTIISINGGAFYGCSSLKNITVADRNTKYHSNSNCIIETVSKELILGCQSSTIPDDGSVVTIGDSAFYYCSGLQSIIIPDTITSIGRNAFYGCKDLISVTIGSGVTSIGYDAFTLNASLDIINYSGDIAGWCKISGLSNIKLHDKELFINGNEIKGELVIPENVTYIADYAFYGCSDLTCLTIPNSVISIGEKAFANCNNIEKARIPAIAIPLITKTKLKTVVILSGDIPKETFYNCKGLINVEISDEVKSIDKQAFYNCDNIETASIPTIAISSIPKINLKKVKITSGDTIDERAFSNCASLTSVSIGNSVTTIGDSAFSNCGKLTDITICEGVTAIGEFTFAECTDLLSIVIPDSVTEIGGGAFYGCSKLVTVKLSSKISSLSCGTRIEPYSRIGYYGFFAGCSSLTSVIIPKDLAYIGDFAFSHCSSLKSLTFLDGVKSIGEQAFRNCGELVSISLPMSINLIEGSAFSGCKSLIEINYEGTKGQWDSIEKEISWNSNTGNYTVYCTDGEIKK